MSDHYDEEDHRWQEAMEELVDELEEGARDHRAEEDREIYLRNLGIDPRANALESSMFVPEDYE